MASDSYRYLCPIASGGMGDVCLALRKEGGFERLYAMKRLRASYERDPAVRSMFADEARIAGLIRHPNVVSVIDVGEDKAGSFLVMDYVEGVSLAELIGSLSRAGLQIPMQVGLKLIRDAAEGLHAAHELRDHDGRPLNLVHRDVSPQNILVGLDGIARVTDFGIARALGRQSRTSTGMMKGKSGYFSPEALRFEPLDRRADLFALGVVLYETLAQRRLYAGESMEQTARRILNEPPPDLGLLRSDAPPAIVEICFEMLAKDPSRRPATAKEVAGRIGEVLAEQQLIEGPIDIGEFLNSQLDVDSISSRRRLAKRALSGAIQLPTVADAMIGTQRTRRAPRRWLMALAAVILVGSGVAFGSFFGQSTSNVDATTATPDAPPPVVQAELPPPAAPVELAVEQSSASVPEESTEEEDTTPSTMTRSRRRAARMRAASMRPPSSGSMADEPWPTW